MKWLKRYVFKSLLKDPIAWVCQSQESSTDLGRHDEMIFPQPSDGLLLAPAEVTCCQIGGVWLVCMPGEVKKGMLVATMCADDPVGDQHQLNTTPSFTAAT